MQKKKIIITGGPGTGKSSIIKDLEKKGYTCLHEISREVILEAQKQGISQLFLENPILFSEKLLEGRIHQHKEASNLNTNLIFIDRGIHDVVAYMNYFKTSYPAKFTDACANYQYSKIFILPPWEEIYTSDNERYESFEEAEKIHHYLKDAYLEYGYSPVEVPKNDIEKRTEFILKSLSEE